MIQRAHSQGDTDTEKTRYRQIREKAASDSQVAQLREKMITASDSDSRKAAAISYSEALFSKMRALDPALSERIDRMEGATKRRIEAGKPLIE